MPGFPTLVLVPPLPVEPLTCLVLPSDDMETAPSRLRVELDHAAGLFEIVDEAMSSRSDRALATGLNGQVLLTPEEARWIRDALTTLLDGDPVDAGTGKGS